MDIFTVSLFGHRDASDLRKWEDRLAATIKELIQTKPYVSFLIGRNGHFDEMSASVIKRVQKETGRDNSDITLVLAYTVAVLNDYEKYYDGILLPDCVCGAHPKAAITLKNRWMVEQSDLVITYISRTTGGAYAAMQYAKKRNKRIVNLYTDSL